MPIKELPEDMQANPSLKDFNDVGSLAKSFLETKAFVGSSIRPPGPDASPEARKDFYEKLQKHAPDLMPVPDAKDADAQKLLWQKLGVPSDEKGYEYKPPEGIDLDVEPLRQAAKEAGLTKGQFAKLAELTANGRAKAIEATKADEAQLKTEWGAAYTDKLVKAAATASKLGVPEAVVKAIASGKMESHQLKLWDNIAKGMGTEPKDLASQQGGGQQALTPGEAKSRIAEIMSNPDYWSRQSPKREGLIAKVMELQKFADGG